jgi:hypothetical protein
LSTLFAVVFLLWIEWSVMDATGGTKPQLTAKLDAARRDGITLGSPELAGEQ